MQPFYEHDGVTLYHGDCAVVLPAVGVKANLILTSPPYDNLRTYGGHGFDFDRVADACVAALADGGVLVWVVADATVDGSETGTSFRQALGFMERGLALYDTMIWRKNSASRPDPTRYTPLFEYMFICSKGRPSTINLIRDKKNKWAGTGNWGKKIKRNVDGTQGSRSVSSAVVQEWGVRDNIWDIPTGIDKRDCFDHPATFPYALAQDHILTWTNPGDVVLDPMAGSGTTLRAAKNLGRKAVGVEIHEEYLHIITERMAQSAMALA